MDLQLPNVTAITEISLGPAVRGLLYVPFGAFTEEAAIMAAVLALLCLIVGCTGSCRGSEPDEPRPAKFKRMDEEEGEVDYSGLPRDELLKRVATAEAKQLKLGARIDQSVEQLGREVARLKAVEKQQQRLSTEVAALRAAADSAEEPSGISVQQPDAPSPRAFAPPAPPARKGAAPRCCLVFEPINSGTFSLQWYEGAEPEGALAYFEPKKPVPRFKLTANGGRSELCRDVGGPRAKRFYEGWAYFLKTAHSFGGGLTFYDNVPAKPVAIYLAGEEAQVTPVRMRQPVAFDGVAAVAVTAASAPGFDVRSMDLLTFLQKGQQAGASLALDGAADAAMEAFRPQSTGITPRQSPRGSPIKAQVQLSSSSSGFASMADVPYPTLPRPSPQRVKSLRTPQSFSAPSTLTAESGAELAAFARAQMASQMRR